MTAARIEPRRAVAYYRVSDAAQGESDKFGLPSQRAAVERYCEAQGYALVGAQTDIGYSGASADRPALLELLDGIDAFDVDVVVVAKWDRLARDAMLFGHLRYTLRKLGVSVESATETNGIDPISTMTEQILAAVAEYERHLISARLANARRVKAAAGGYAGGVAPYGYRSDGAGTLVPVPEELEQLRVMAELRANGMSYAEIALHLRTRDVPTRKGGTWRSGVVYEILRSASKRKELTHGDH